MYRLFRLTLPLLLAALLLAACGDNSANNNANSASESPGAAASEASESASPASSPSDAAASEAVWPLVYTDSQGNEAVLEKQPERIVSVFHAMYPDYLYSLGIYPIGVASSDALLSQWDAYESFVTEHSVVDIGAPNDPNLEKILELKPDLILGYAGNAEQYESLSKIAPTILLDYASINQDWRFGVNEFAKILGKEDQASIVIDRTEQAVKDAAAKLADFRSKNETVMFISAVDKTIWPYTVEQLQTIYSSESGLGLKAPEGYEKVTDRSTALALEALVEYNPDHLFLMTDYGDDATQQWLDGLKNDKVWSSISAVKNGNLYMTDRSIFAFNAPIATQYGVNLVAGRLTD
ncbi:iron-siderophore ABC transporter substrate-binding protein [Cohnella fermenti]|uniref:Iron-siderophore ABC transporter substrate-binding protein n=1 Tax=Cohnella fermenti TaxID=2565925 RepID=A0A4S4BS94_9BACL|nr:iron-siderophore ABC transporter substrate-binding protein [Cohnella fermenti]THF77086.1 iron-siderophore ABC transporter substrate-binding protein [Cohnella fermenti]